MISFKFCRFCFEYSFGIFVTFKEAGCPWRVKGLVLFCTGRRFGYTGIADALNFLLSFAWTCSSARFCSSLDFDFACSFTQLSLKDSGIVRVRFSSGHLSVQDIHTTALSSPFCNHLLFILFNCLHFKLCRTFWGARLIDALDLVASL